MKKVFESVYDNKIWYKGSGSGSLPSNTKEYRKFLQRYLIDNDIKKVIDIVCGDWSFSRLINWLDIQYLGIDIVDSLIKKNKELYEKKNIKFKCANISEFKLPKGDLIIIKDVFQHWSNEEILEFLPSLEKFNHILIINTCEGPNLNKEIKNGEMRPLDLSKPPFSCRLKEKLKWRSWRPVKKIWEIKSVVELEYD